MSSLPRAIPLYLGYFCWGALATGVLGRGILKRRSVYPAAIAGALSFELLRFTQIPLQSGYFTHVYGLLLNAGVPDLLAVSGMALISGIVQEAFKSAITGVRFFSLRGTRTVRMGIGIGALTGAGFGIYEASSLTGVPYSLGLLGTVAVIERAIAIVFHVGTGALAGYGFATRRPLRFVLLAMLIHGTVNYLIFPFRMGKFSMELFYLLIGAMTSAVFLWMLVRTANRSMSH